MNFPLTVVAPYERTVPYDPSGISCLPWELSSYYPTSYKEQGMKTQEQYFPSVLCPNYKTLIIHLSYSQTTVYFL